jgi:hypothetical protein
MEDTMTDQQIIQALRWVLGFYYANHPEVGDIKLRCYSRDGSADWSGTGLLYAHHFSPPPSGSSPVEQEAFVEQLGIATRPADEKLALDHSSWPEHIRRHIR